MSDFNAKMHQIRFWLHDPWLVWRGTGCTPLIAATKHTMS